MKLQLNTNHYVGLGIVCIYALLTYFCAENVFFWDTIQQISREAHWYYESNFSSLLLAPFSSGLETTGTGYHPPLMGLMTAALWKLFGQELWVSHLFAAFWACILILQTGKLLRLLFPEKYVPWLLPLLLLESTVLAQFAIASPDFILLTAFVMTVRGILEEKRNLILIGFFFLCAINMRGFFAGIILLASHMLIYFKGEKKTSFFSTFMPYLPALLILASYFTYYFSVRGWFFSDSAYTEHYSLPKGGFPQIAKQIFAFILRSVENGRFFIYFLGLFLLVKIMKNKQAGRIDNTSLFLLSAFLLLSGMYFLFCIISQMPFSGRYFMPQFFLLSLLVFRGLISYLSPRKLQIAFALSLVFFLTGHCWIYPEKISKSWDSTLAHLPYYQLRKDCFDYIEKGGISYEDVSAGFCLSGDRRFAELEHAGKKVGSELDRSYFIYSNISNLRDDQVDKFKNEEDWELVQKFYKWPVFIAIYKNRTKLNQNNNVQ